MTDFPSPAQASRSQPPDSQTIPHSLRFTLTLLEHPAMTRYYHFVNGMEMAVLAEATKQLHSAGYASTLDLVYSVAQQALDRLPPLYFSIKPLNQATTSNPSAQSSSNSTSASNSSTQAKQGRSTADPKLLHTSGQSSNRTLSKKQKKQMQTAVRQAIQSLMQRQHQEPLPHEFWYSPSPWSDFNSVGGCLPTNCYYG